MCVYRMHCYRCNSMFQNKTVSYSFIGTYYDREVSSKLTVPLYIRVLLYIYIYVTMYYCVHVYKKG